MFRVVFAEVGSGRSVVAPLRYFAIRTQQVRSAFGPISRHRNVSGSSSIALIRANSCVMSLPLSLQRRDVLQHNARTLQRSAAQRGATAAPT